MTPDQEEVRDERVAIMMDSGISEEEAHKYCDSNTRLYGIREQALTQDDLFKRYF